MHFADILLSMLCLNLKTAYRIKVHLIFNDWLTIDITNSSDKAK